jgi:hypothetical protein
VPEVTLWVVLFAVVCVAYGVLAVLSARAGRGAAEVLLTIGLASAVFAGRAVFGHGSALGALRGATLMPSLILFVTGGRPSRVFDRRIKARTLRRMPKGERQAFEREDFKSGMSQFALTVCVVVGAIVYVVGDLTFLD